MEGHFQFRSQVYLFTRDQIDSVLSEKEVKSLGIYAFHTNVLNDEDCEVWHSILPTHFYMTCHSSKD